MKAVEGITDFKSAEAYVMAGKNKEERPLKSGYRIRKDHPLFFTSTISIYYSWGGAQSIITYKPDNTTVINLDELRQYRQDTRAKLVAGYTPVQYLYKDQLWADSTVGHTPAKVTKCRTCRGTGQTEQWCWESSWCFIRADEVCSTHGVARTKGQGAYHRSPCQHGEEGYHKDQRTLNTCPKCEGATTYDYGSKPIGFSMDGYNKLTIIDTNIVRSGL
jgi:hypothetical protein